MTAFPCLASAEAGKNNRKAEAGNKLSFSIIDDANIGRPHAGNKLNFFQHFPGVSVNLRNANLFIEFTDIASRSKPQPMVVTRTYNSRTNYNGQFGWGWASFPSDIRIELDKRSGNIVEYKDDGSFITYFPAGKDSYVNRATSDNLKVMRNKNGMVYIKKSQNDGQWFFNESGHLIKHIDLDDNTLAIKRRGAIIDNVVDSRQKAVRFLYNNRNKIEAIIDSNGKKWQYTYDSKDHLISVQKPDGFTDSFEYDSLHNLVSWNRPGTGLIKMTYDAENDWIIEQKGPEKQHSRYHYEIDRQSPDRSKTTVIDSRGNKDVHIFSGWKEHIVQADGTSYIQRFDERGYPASITDALGNTEKTLYDQLGRIIERVNILGGIARFAYYGQTNRIRSLTDEQGGIWSFSYTKAGNLSELTDPKGGKYSFRDNKRGLVESVTFPSGRAYKFKYNEEGHVISHIDPLGFKSLLSYNNEGSMNRFVDPGGKTKKVRYDASGRIVSLKGDVINPIGFFYDKQGNITGVEGEEGYKIQYGYDGHGNRTSALIPPERKMQFVYDGLGAITKIKEDGKEVNVVYDNRGRPLRIDFSDGDFLLYEYDAAGNVVRKKNKNRDYSITYINNLVAEIKDQVTGFSNKYTYDRSGNRTGMEDSSGAKTFYSYDQAKRLVEINNSNVGSIRFVYDEDGFLIAKEFPNGIQQRYVYDKGGRLIKSYFTKNGSDKNSGDVVMSHAYTYDLSSNVSEIQNYLGEITTYKYDKRSRLISAKYPDGITENFDFTKTGNRMVRGHDDKTLYNTAGQLLGDSVFSYTYNTDGSLKEKLSKKTYQITTYEYNSLGQMNEVVEFTGPNRERKTLGTYQYDGLGRRVKQKGSDRIRNFNYDGLDMTSESDEEGRVIARYVFGPGIDQPLAMSHNEKVYYYATDGRGNIMGLIDEKGALVNTYDYRAYGEVFRKKEKTSNPFTYRAREFDSETSLYYYRARYYDPMAGVFTSMDPNVLVGSVSPYRYASWNPVSYYDPLGLFDIFEPKSLFGIIFGIVALPLLASGSVPLFLAGLFAGVTSGGLLYSSAKNAKPPQMAYNSRISQYIAKQIVQKDPKTGQLTINEENLKIAESVSKNKNFRKQIVDDINEYNKQIQKPIGGPKSGPGSGPPAKQTPPPVKPGPGSGPPVTQKGVEKKCDPEVHKLEEIRNEVFKAQKNAKNILDQLESIITETGTLLSKLEIDVAVLEQAEKGCAGAGDLVNEINDLAGQSTTNSNHIVQKLGEALTLANNCTAATGVADAANITVIHRIATFAFDGLENNLKKARALHARLKKILDDASKTNLKQVGDKARSIEGKIKISVAKLADAKDALKTLDDSIKKLDNEKNAIISTIRSINAKDDFIVECEVKLMNASDVTFYRNWLSKNNKRINKADALIKKYDNKHEVLNNRIPKKQPCENIQNSDRNMDKMESDFIAVSLAFRDDLPALARACRTKTQQPQQQQPQPQVGATVGGNVGAGAGAGARVNVAIPPPPGRATLVAWGPKPRTITVPCGTEPVVRFSFAYLDYNDPHRDGWAEETIANCDIEEDEYKRPGTYQVTCTAKSTRNHEKSAIAEIIVTKRKGGCETGQTPSIFGAPIFPSKCGPGETHNTQGECVKVSSITEIHSQLGAKERSHIESRGQRENIDVENQWLTGPKQSQSVEKWTKAYVGSRVKKTKKGEEHQKPSSPEGGNGASTSGEAASSASSTPTKPGSQPAEEFDWGQTLPYAAYIYHVTKTYTYSGSFDRDMYLCHKAEKPDANGQIHDSLGHYQASKVAGPLTTPKAICEAYSGLDPAKGRAPGGWAGVNFNCGAYSPK